ncbi:MAG TPA: hypothetical protein VN955_02370 [Gemmatimonadales bacterium]|nr:hypothetical protein [Gemmatimonadales bacterium]
MLCIRPFQRGDIPALVALRRRAFHYSEQASDQALAAYFQAVFADWPWADPSLPSLVSEDERGRLVGFVGVLPRPMRFRGALLRAAATTQFMVAPDADPLTAARLARACLAGPQDLTLADAANEGARRVWVASGGGTAWAYSLHWQKPIRPARHAAARWPRGSSAWAALLAARPLLHMVDALTAAPRRPAGAAEPIDAAAMAAQFPEITAGRALEPCYDAVGLDWLLQRAAEKTSLGLLERLRVRDPRGEPAGWFLYYLNPGGVCQVLQVAPRPGAERLVLEHLWYQAWRGGAVALEGRVEPALLPALADQGCRLARRGAWMLCASRHPDVELAIQRGDAFLSRLEGEWWVNF